ncbi:MAG: 3-deoxy-manno-octulosonate cytidylyltransferase [Methylococcaceae bacterium]|nr:3-deoxy-manno-octulosonate cytidylyltransferase [Methylococcaceae bacterium]
MAAPCKIVIPARYGSSRLPGKPLLPIAGKPMIVHVCERALEAGCGEVFVATDDHRIAEAVDGVGVTAVMTREDHNSGSERIAEVADRLGWSDTELVINLQGDEPAMDPDLIRQLADALSREKVAKVATLAAPIENIAEVFNPNTVKVVLDGQGYSLYFSRAPIPYYRNGFSADRVNLPEARCWLRHIGIYGYFVGFLRRYIVAPVSELERVECLEQLRILFMGERIRVIQVDQAPEAGVDTAEDLARVRAGLGN